MRRTITLCAFLLVFVFGQALAQEKTITGRVTSSQDTLPVPGVTIVVVGTTIGTSTNADGNYTLNVPGVAKQLKFSGIGLKFRTVDIGTSTSLDVVLDPDIMKLDEVVVTSIAIEREKRSLGYATTQVKGDELTSGNNSNVIGALQGKVSGVNVTSFSSSPGSSQRIVIRGGSSLLGNNQALMVVDGVPIDNSNYGTQDPTNNFARNDLNDQTDYGNRGNDINPDDIESISVLKGPAAAALYGSSASNGAIIITTKKGHRTMGGKSKMDVTFNTNVTFSSILKLPDFQNDFGQGDLDNVPDDKRENFSWGLPFDGHLRPWGQQINGLQRVKPYVAIPNNVKDFFDVGVAYTNYLSFSGGSEKNAYFLSLSTLNSDGIVPTTGYDKYTLHFNGSSELTNHFTTNVSVNYNNISSTLPSGGQLTNSLYSNLIETPRDIPIVDGKNQNDPFNKYDDVTGTYGFYNGYYINPYFILDNFRSYNYVDRVFGNVAVSYHNWDWLDITDRFGGDIISDRREQKWKKFNYAPLDESGDYTWNNQTYQGKYSQDIYNTVNYTNDLMVTAKHKLTDDITGTLLLGQNVRQFQTTNAFTQTNGDGGLNLPDYYNLDNSNGAALSRSSLSQKRLLGYYADLNFAYKNYLFLGLTGRSDKSSTLPTANSSYFYPSANASFVFTELMNSKFKDDILSYGKVRASYAKVGNDASPYQTTTVYQVTNISGNFGNTKFPIAYPNNAVSGFSLGNQLGNDKITPEFTKAFEVGTELGLLKDRLMIDFSYYQNSSTDQIIPLLLPSSSGFETKIINTGEVQNKGIELAVRGVPVLTHSGFKWELYGTYTKNTNKVISINEAVPKIVFGGFSGMGISAQVGEPYGTLYAIDLQKDPEGHVIVDANGLPLITTSQVNKGTYMPTYMASLGTTLSYKGFTFNILFDTKQGGVFYSHTKNIMDFNGTSALTAEEGRVDRVWPNSVQKDDQGHYVTNTTPFHPYSYYVTDEQKAYGQMIVDASYVKLRETSLSYDLPHKWISKTPFGNATIGVFGNNLMLWTAKENKYADPELNSSGASNVQGFEYQPTPSQRNYGVDLKFTF